MICDETIKAPPNHLKPGAVLRHFKGDFCLVRGSCFLEKTGELGVLFTHVGRDRDREILWVRPADSFDEIVNSPKGPVPRYIPSSREELLRSVLAKM